MNEYVLSMNDQQLPLNPQCLNCGISQTFTLSIGEEISKSFSYCVDLGPLVGFSEISWSFLNIEEGETFEISANYNGTIVTSGPTDEGGSIFFDKNNILIETVEITITYTGDMVVDVIADCCQSEQMTIVEVVFTNNSEGGSTIHTQYRYTNGDFIGPIFQNLVLFSVGTGTPLVSRYNTITGFVGSGGLPPEFSNMRLSTNAIPPDNYIFNIAQNKFRYLRSSILYDNNNLDMVDLLIASVVATPNMGSAPLYYADFTVPASSSGEYLYLIWDLRNAILDELCFGSTRIDSCCNCVPGNYYLNASFENATCVFNDDDLLVIADDGFYSTEGIVRELVDGVLLPPQACAPCAVEASLCFGATLLDVCCNCDESCLTPYNSYLIDNANDFGVTVGFNGETGIYQEIVVPENAEGFELCSIGYPTCLVSNVTITFNNCLCGL